MEKLVFLPPPRRVVSEVGTLTLKNGFGIACKGRPAAMFPIAESVVRDAGSLQPLILSGPSGKDDACQLVFRLANSGETKPQGYRLKIARDHVFIESSDLAGLFYGAMTLRQILRQCGKNLPCGLIEDEPVFPTRGVMLDISRDKVPTMETLCRVVDLLAELKINHLELYTEHTFAYRNHKEVWENASPMTADEVRALGDYCAERFIELVPNQNSFGHLHRWLKHPRYRELAECPDGYVTPWGEKRNLPFSLNPLDPRSLALIDELYEELFPNFRSEFFNVGCDETFDLGQGKSKAECERIGKGRVYLDFLLKIYERVKRNDKSMLFWGDIVLNHPELIAELPKDVTALVWGYEADHPFDEQCAKFAKAKIPFYVCPGTSTWNSIAGRTDNALKNLQAAADAGLKHGAIGYLITDWGDNGHWQPLPVSFLAYAAGASFAWSGKTTKLEDALNRHVFLDDAQVMGTFAHDLGNAYLHAGHTLFNASALFRLLQQDNIDALKEKITVAEAESFIRSTLERLSGAKINAVMTREFTLAAKMLLAGLARINGQSMDPAILEEFQALWLIRNRPGGLSDSIKPLQRRLEKSL